MTKLEKYRLKVKKEVSFSCRSAYLEFKKEKNITLEDPVINEDDNNDQNIIRNKKLSIQKANSLPSNAFLKDSIPYAQDATRKKYFKKILKYIRLVDFLFSYAKVDLIKNSLKLLGKRFARSYECYLNNWNDIPFIIIMIITLGDKISYSPAIELIKSAIFDNFIQENISQVINMKNFLNPEEFPQYMVSFEDVFDINMDQNGALNSRIKEDQEFRNLLLDIKKSFKNCHNALEEMAKSLTPTLINYNKFIKLDFNQIELKKKVNLFLN